jgi:hypothetical protein
VEDSNRQDVGLKGSLGQFDSCTDPNNDLVDHDGDVMIDLNTFLEG